MNPIKQILAMTRKELLVMLKLPGIWIEILLVPLIFIWITGAVFGGSETIRVALFVVNEDQGKSGLQVMAALKEAPRLEVSVLASRAEADRLVGAGERMAALVIPAGFSEALLTPEGAELLLIVDPARDERSSIVKGLVNEALARFLVNAEVTRGLDKGVNQAVGSLGNLGSNQEQVLRFIKSGLQAVVASQVQDAIDHPLVKVELKSASQRVSRPPNLFEYLVPGYTLMFGFFLVQMMATTVVEERSLGTLRRLLSAPARRAVLLAGKMLPYYLVSVAQFFLITLISHFAFGLGLGNSAPALILVIACAAFSIVAFGIMMAAIVKTMGQASGLTTLLVLAMAAVSGAMFPSIQIPGLQLVTPHYWAIRAFQNVITRGMGIEGILMPCGVLLGISAVCFVIGLSRFKFD
ncbi:MAG TPA: ABC transporter permease [Anaerolineaceae bacterium]